MHVVAEVTCCSSEQHLPLRLLLHKADLLVSAMLGCRHAMKLHETFTGRERSSHKSPTDARFQPLQTSQGGGKGADQLRIHHHNCGTSRAVFTNPANTQELLIADAFDRVSSRVHTAYLRRRRSRTPPAPAVQPSQLPV
jgi:hypothetical protein